MKPICGLGKLAIEAGLPFTNFLTLRSPHAETDSKRKRLLTRELAHLGQALERAGQPHFGLTVFEKKPGGLLHAHHILHVHREAKRAVARWVETVNARLGDGTAHVRRFRPGIDLQYITKQRLPLSSKVEAAISHGRQKGASIPGKRWTMTAALKAALQSPKQAHNDLPPVNVSPLQLPLLGLPPASPVMLQIEQKRKALGLTQREAAQRLGIKQPAYSNAVVRLHDRLSPWAMNRAREFIAEGWAA